MELINCVIYYYVDKENQLFFSQILFSLKFRTIVRLYLLLRALETEPNLLLLGERTFGVLTKLDLMDKGTNALDVSLQIFLLSYSNGRSCPALLCFILFLTHGDVFHILRGYFHILRGYSLFPL